MESTFRCRAKLAFFGGSRRVSSARRGRGVAARVVMTITSVALAASLTGCGIRMETPQPTEPVPDVNEVSRQTMVDDLLLISHESADAATLTTNSSQAQILTALADLSTAQKNSIGGVYTSGLPDAPTASASPSPTTTDSAPQDPTPASVIGKLSDSALRIRSALAVPTDADLARAYASLAISHMNSARSLAKKFDISFQVPSEFESDAWAQPDFLDEQDVIDLVRAEDAAGYAFEVIAAMQNPDARDRALKTARLHRAFAADLAASAGIVGTHKDPRLVAYELPFTLTADQPLAPSKELKALAQELESSLAGDYLSLIDSVDPESRMLLLDLAMSRGMLAADWGATLGEFPFLGNGETVSSSATAQD